MRTLASSSNPSESSPQSANCPSPAECEVSHQHDTEASSFLACLRLQVPLAQSPHLQTKH